MFANEHVKCRRGRARCSLFIFFGLLLQCRAHSFYDNPEQGPLPSGPDADDELHRKWDHEFRGFNHRRGLNPYTSPYTILDCGDIPVTPFDNALALRQMSEAFLELGSRTPALSEGDNPKPKLLTLGGDHSVALPALRALNKIYGGPIAVLHFDAHLDTWHPAKYPSAWESAQSDFTHGSMFWIASNEGLILNCSSAHAGLRTRLSGDGWDDIVDDERQGFLRILSDDIDELGWVAAS
ncbi:MAG: hypothetical protein Q9172_000770 [Xanthocarpia lactea]